MKINQKNVWDKIAENWNDYRKKPFQEVIEFLKNKKGKILDVGCGSGRNFIKNEGLEFYGVDFSQKMLSLAEKNAEEKNIKVELKPMEDEKIPYENNFFDYILCISVLHCIETKEKREKLIDEIKRVLKKDGQALISVWSKNNKKTKGKLKEAFIPWKIEGKEYLRYYYFYDLNELEEILKKKKFKILEKKENENIWFLIKK